MAALAWQSRQDPKISRRISSRMLLRSGQTLHIDLAVTRNPTRVKFPPRTICVIMGPPQMLPSRDRCRMGDQLAADRHLDERCDAIVGKWYAAIVDTGYPALSSMQVRQELRVQVAKAIDLLAAEQLNSSGAEQIGVALARLHYIQPEALARTLRVLREQLGSMCPAGGAIEYLDRLAALLAGISTGFLQQTCKIVLEEQEAIRAALVSEIERSRMALLAAQGELEKRVIDRTADLARANQELRAEVVERTRFEDALRESEEKYRRLVEDMHEVIYNTDLMGNLTYVSPSVKAVLEYSPAEVSGHRFDAFAHPEDLPRIQRGFQNLLAGQSQESVYRFVTKSGETRWVRTSSSPVLYDSSIVGIQGLLTDITDSHQARAALQTSQERLRLLMENAPVLVLTVGPDLKIRFVNRDPAETTRQMDLLDRSMLDYVQPDYAGPVEQIVRQIFATGSSDNLELAVMGQGGRDAWYSVRFGPLWQDGDVAEVMLVAEDVTEQKRVADLKDNLIRDVSHELRTPLAKVQMSLDRLVDMLEEGEIDREKAIRVSGFATRSTERMLRTVENILDLSRLESGTWPHEQQSIQPRLLIHEAITYATPLSSAKGLELIADLPESLPDVRGDWDKLYRVLHNLVHNAIKFSEEGRIVVTAEDRGQELAIGVRDEGQGILPENLEQVFQRFFQEKARHLGAGLGLAICKAIVEEHGGRIWAESAGRGQGATFWFTVPVDAKEEGAA